MGCLGSDVPMADRTTTLPWLNQAAEVKGGDDVIFAWFSRYLSAVKSGVDAVNGTVGTLLDDSGRLFVHEAVLAAIHRQSATDIAAYAPLRGLPAFRELAIDLAVGHHRNELSHLHPRAFATPGGCGALYLSAANLAAPGDAVLLRECHWGPYRTILRENGLHAATWPLIGPAAPDGRFVDSESLFSSLSSLAHDQASVLMWINDPAHNPTGLSLGSDDRQILLNSVVSAALDYPDVGFSLLIDAAYARYSSEPHGWAGTLGDLKEWPTNLLVAVAVSCSKSHTIYGMRLGALVTFHPESEVHEQLETTWLHTGRGTWSGTPRLPQSALIDLHTSVLEEEWLDSVLKAKDLLDGRRAHFIDLCREHGVSLLPSHDGYFAWHPCSDPESVAAEVAEDSVFLVPLDKGVRIGLCAIPEASLSRVALALSRTRG